MDAVPVIATVGIVIPAATVTTGIVAVELAEAVMVVPVTMAGAEIPAAAEAGEAAMVVPAVITGAGMAPEAKTALTAILVFGSFAAGSVAVADTAVAFTVAPPPA